MLQESWKTIGEERLWVAASVKSLTWSPQWIWAQNGKETMFCKDKGVENINWNARIGWVTLGDPPVKGSMSSSSTFLLLPLVTLPLLRKT